MSLSLVIPPWQSDSVRFFWQVAVACLSPLLADAVEKVGFDLHSKKVRA
jgi:hypothetical protein